MFIQSTGGGGGAESVILWENAPYSTLQRFNQTHVSISEDERSGR